ncbi:hypothetical protein IPF86_01015 [Candidatus Nomurabacteria bacterium]|jgi:hypothetical protein|nr:MAG: hypothetical protein IPF86_01015 [Candidatus Nomurabacteria bacterium]
MTQKIHSVFSGFVMFILQIKKSTKEKSDYELARWKVTQAGSFEEANKELNKFLDKYEKILTDESNVLYESKSKNVDELCGLIYKKWPSEALKHLSIKAFIYRK